MFIIDVGKNILCVYFLRFQRRLISSRLNPSLKNNAVKQEVKMWKRFQNLYLQNFKILKKSIFFLF